MAFVAMEHYRVAGPTAPDWRLEHERFAAVSLYPLANFIPEAE
jgi:hypothetical protein